MNKKGKKDERGRGLETLLMVQNSLLLGHSITHFPTSSRVSERKQTNECSRARKRSELCGASEGVSGMSERANGRASGSIPTSRILDVL